MAKDPGDLPEFQQWIKTVPRENLEELLMDAYWKDPTFRETEIVRFFKLEQEGINMIQRPEPC